MTRKQAGIFNYVKGYLLHTNIKWNFKLFKNDYIVFENNSLKVSFLWCTITNHLLVEFITTTTTNNTIVLVENKKCYCLNTNNNTKDINAIIKSLLIENGYIKNEK